MNEEVERRSLGEQLDLEGTEDEFSKCGKSKIKYTKALLLEITEAEVCRKLPGDFDLLILSELNEPAGGTVEHNRISGISSLLGQLSSGRWDTGFPGQRWYNHLLMLSKESHSRGNCSSERSDVSQQQLPQESGDDAVVLGQKAPESGLFQLRKSENPYRPPHLNKKMPEPLDTNSELGVNSSGNSSFAAVESAQRCSADSITENDKPGNVSPLSSLDDPIEEKLHECDNEVGEMIGASDKLELGIIEDNLPTFEDFWAEILDILQQQQESELRQVETCLPDEDGSSSVDHSTIPKTSNFSMLDNNDDAANSEAEIIWPDEDSLITVYDMIGFNRSSPTFNRDFLEFNKATPSIPFDIRDNSESLSGKMHYQLSPSQTSNNIFTPEEPFFHLGHDHMNFLTKSYRTPYIPTCSNFHQQSCLGTTLTNTKANDSYFQYSVLQQPSISPKQQYHQRVDMSCPNPPINQAATRDLNPYSCFTSKQATYQGFVKSNAGSFGDREPFSFWHNQY